MAVHFHPLKVKKVIRETSDCVSVTFDVPPELVSEFEYKEGQNITIKTIIEGNELRRSYSLCTAPHENEVKVAIKKVGGGLFSKYANESLKAGDILEVLPPVGKFNARMSKEGKGSYLAIAAGSGITPVISIIKHTLQKEPASSFTLLYGNKSRSSIIFFEELEGLKNKYMQRFNLVNILSQERTESEINYGRIDGQKLLSLQQLIDFKSFDSIYLCGPEQLIFGSGAFLEKLGVPKEKIHFELFTTPGQGKPVEETMVNTSQAIGGSIISIQLDGRQIQFELAKNGPSILDAALQQGADLPYACKGGVCCTCRAKLISGTVVMDVNFALEPEEVAEGFILTCQSHPTSDSVVVDFDTR